MNIEEKILQFAKTKKNFTSSDLVKKFNVTRQYLHPALTKLIASSRLIKTGAFRYTQYALPENFSYLGKHLHEKFRNQNLEEWKVLEKISLQAPFIYSGNENAGSIFDYAFSEMLNNAIEHSKSKNIEIDVNTQDNTVLFTIRDHGIGVFKNIMKKRKLPSELEAIRDLLKGKITTAPRAHSGEGIFFTSKAADIFTLNSFNYRLIIDNRLPDIFIEEISPEIKGTEVIFQISKNIKKHLASIFAEYQTNPEEYAFNKTEIKVRLYELGGVHISRSQARRLLAGLEKFKRVYLDFDKVPTVGQAFADEIFRVFKIKHPEIETIPINMNKVVEFMIGRVEKP
jgi:two-component sensor histidine kinase